MPLADQPANDIPAHAAQADYAELHVWILLTPHCAGDMILPICSVSVRHNGGSYIDAFTGGDVSPATDLTPHAARSRDIDVICSATQYVVTPGSCLCHAAFNMLD
jgi:hypothetical protein